MKPHKRLLRLTGCGLAVLVLIVGLWLRPQAFRSIDETAMFAAASNTLKWGVPHINDMAFQMWTPRRGESVAALGYDHNVYTKKSPLVILMLLPLLSWLKVFPQLNPIALALTLGSLMTALTAWLLYDLIHDLGYSGKTAALSTALFAFCTMALPYMQTIFGEVVGTLGIVLLLRGIWRLFALNPDSEIKACSKTGLELGGGLGLAIGVNLVYLLLLPLAGVLLAYWWNAQAALPRRKKISVLLGTAFPVITLGVGLACYNTARFGSPFATGYHFASGDETFVPALMWWGVLGLTVSPARGFIWYNPTAGLAMMGWRDFRRAYPSLAWSIAGLIVFHLGVFGSWWQWWGGWGWGPRFLLPLTPCITLVSLPLIDRALKRTTSTAWVRASVILFTALGALVQIAATGVNYLHLEMELEEKYPAPPTKPLLYHHAPFLVYDVAHSPILKHLQQISSPTARQEVILTSGFQFDTILATIQTEQLPGDLLVYMVPELQDVLLSKWDLPPTLGAPYEDLAQEPLAQSIFLHNIESAQRVWLITWYGPADESNWYEQYLREHWAIMNEQWPPNELRLLLFANPPRFEQQNSVEATFGPMKLVNFKQQRQNNMVYSEFTWEAIRPITQSYTLSLHLLDLHTGALIAQNDHLPLGGYHPTDSWPLGRPVTERVAFSLSDAHTEPVLRIGWYLWPQLTLLPTHLPDGAEGTMLLLTNPPQAISP